MAYGTPNKRTCSGLFVGRSSKWLSMPGASFSSANQCGVAGGVNSLYSTSLRAVRGMRLTVRGFMQ